MGWAGYEILRLERRKGEELAAAQLEVLVRSRYSDLASGKYRDFVEGAGASYPSLHLSIEEDGQRNHFEFGHTVFGESCSAKTVAIPEQGNVSISLCRENTLPVVPLSALAGLLLAALYFGFLFISRLEESATSNLIAIFASIGVKVRTDGGLRGIFSRVNELTTELVAEREHAISLSKYKAIGELAGQVAHDLRSPLAALRSENRSSGNPKPNAPDLPVFDQALDRLDEIVKGLLSNYQAVLKNEFANADLTQFAATDVLPLVRQLVNESLAAWRSDAQKSNAILNSSLPSDIRVFVKIDPSGFKRVVSNVLNNAAESVELGTVKIDVSAAVEDNTFHLVIRDNGRGIPAELLERLGQKGLTVGKTTGTGLGISHAIRAVESWGGKIAFKSPSTTEAEGGTAVTISIPLVYLKDSNSVPETVIVDDDIWIREAWETEAKKSQRTVFCYESAEDLLAHIGQHSEETIFMVDYDLGGTRDGLDVVRELKGRGFTKLYLSTGFDPAVLGGINELRAAGVLDVVGKEVPAWWRL